MCKFVFSLTVVSVEREIFFGTVKKIQVMGIEGEMGIFPGHSPLLTCVKPGILHFIKKCGNSEYMYLSGGMLEIQRDVVTILADTVIRADELDERRAKESKDQSAAHLRFLSYSDKNYMKISIEMSKAIAKLRLIKLVKNNNCI